MKTSSMVRWAILHKGHFLREKSNNTYSTFNTQEDAEKAISGVPNRALFKIVKAKITLTETTFRITE